MIHLSFVLESTRTAPELARRAIRGCLDEALPATTLHDLGVVTTELVANAVEHGPGGQIEVRIAVEEDGQVCGEVRDQGSQPILIPPPPARTDDGLGLQIVDALTDRLSTERGRAQISFELSSPP